jgi:hypothetical protein
VENRSTDNWTTPQDRGTIRRSFDTESNYTESTGIEGNYTDSIDTLGIRHTGIASS